MTKQDFLNAVSKLNEKNYQSFISMYGVITDEEVAKDALCVTCKAWYVLSDELKQNADVIMFYQPNLFINQRHDYAFVNDSIMPHNVWFGDIYAADIGFIANPNCQIKCDSCEENKSLYGFYRQQQPNIKYPDDFNFYLYYAIQNQLMMGERYNLCDALKDNKLNQMIPDAYKTGVHEGSILVMMLDRQRLREIVETLKPEYSGTARQKNQIL